MLSWGLTVVLAAIAGLHFYWAFGGLWPCDDERSLVRTVIGHADRKRMPPFWMTIVVAVMLAAMTSWPLVLAGLAWAIVGLPLMIAGSAILTALFLTRGVAGYVPAWRRLYPVQPFARLDRTLYSPLCLVPGTGFLALTLKQGGI